MKTSELLCECGCGKEGHDLHHCMIGRHNRFPILNHVFNYARVNHWEHINRKFDNVKWRRYFYERQCEKYGKAVIDNWLAEVQRTTKLHKSRFDFMLSPTPNAFIGFAPNGKLEITETGSEG